MRLATGQLPTDAYPIALPTAATLYQDLLAWVVNRVTSDPIPWHLVGVISGGARLTKQLAHDVEQQTGQTLSIGQVSSMLHRDDFAQRGLKTVPQSVLPFQVDGAQILLIDDVLYTGRTLRAVLNELFDYGRPAQVQLAVLAERTGRQLPIAAQFAGASVDLPPSQRLSLVFDASDALSWHILHA